MSNKRTDPPQKPAIDEATLNIAESDFFGLVEALFRDHDPVGLILLLDALAGDAISSWRRAGDSTEEEVAAARDAHLLPAIHRIGRMCLDALRFRQPVVFQEGLERLARIYDLGRFEGLGTVRRPAHLSWTVPSKHALVQLYIVGSYVVFRRRTSELQTLLQLRAHEGHRRNPVPLLSHPHFQTHSGEGDLRTHFADARRAIVDTPSLHQMFLYDVDLVIDAMCQFDFIVAFSAWIEGKNSFPNYADYPIYRVSPIIEQMSELDTCETLFGRAGCQLLADFLRLASGVSGQRRSVSNMWRPSEWTDAMRQFLEKHPPREEGTPP